VSTITPARYNTARHHSSDLYRGQSLAQPLPYRPPSSMTQDNYGSSQEQPIQPFNRRSQTIRHQQPTGLPCHTGNSLQLSRCSPVIRHIGLPVFPVILGKAFGSALPADQSLGVQSPGVRSRPPDLPLGSELCRDRTRLQALTSIKGGVVTPSWTTPHHKSPLDEINEIRRNAADSLWVLKVTRRRILPLTAIM